MNNFDKIKTKFDKEIRNKIKEVLKLSLYFSDEKIYLVLKKINEEYELKSMTDEILVRYILDEAHGKIEKGYVICLSEIVTIKEELRDIYENLKKLNKIDSDNFEEWFNNEYDFEEYIDIYEEISKTKFDEFFKNSEEYKDDYYKTEVKED